MYQILKAELNSPTKFKEKFWKYFRDLATEIEKKNDIKFDSEELSELLLSACRVNDFNVVNRQENKLFLDKDRVLSWIMEKLIPNTVILSLGDENIIRLLIFSIEITYQMFAGGTRATVTQKGFRDRRRTFESILADQFIGKLGEIFVKEFFEKNFNISIELDWKISKDINKFKENDILNAKRRVSIKSTPTLTVGWAEAPIGSDYGIYVKCSTPQQPILQFFIEACGFSKLLEFADEKISPDDELFKNYLSEIKKRLTAYKCGEMQTYLKGFICGYFRTSEYSTIREGESLPFMGVVREERYLVPVNELKWTREEWKMFLHEIELL